MIRRLLVANRGEIARRVFATCRAMGIETVAVFSDADAEAPHTSDADYAVRLPGVSPAATYLRADLLIEAARRSGADAIHPGYGFLSENAEFAAAVADAGLIWIGPPPKAIAAMGAKLDAKALLADAGVPMLPSWTDPAQVEGPYPVLVKASYGGGGRGMRIVRAPEDLPDAVAAASREAAAAFADGTVFIERYVEQSRHVEVQVIADTHGTVVALGERECSIQRRHQKIIEEVPSPAVGPELRESLCAAAVAAARAVEYVGAGTVEFLLAPSGEFFFLEMNTRLQVEHPVTECVTGLDLVRLQITIAEGAPLGFNAPPPIRGHAIEVRLYAEDPAAGWQPSTGLLHRFALSGVSTRFAVPAVPGLRLDSGVEDGSTVSIHYDPMLAKVIAWAPERSAAARALAAALARAEIHGVTTNRDLLVRVLRHPAFGVGATDTGFLDRYAGVFEPLLDEDACWLAAHAAALAGAGSFGTFPPGWRNNASAPQRVSFAGPYGQIDVSYSFGRDGQLIEGVTLVSRDPSAVVFELDGIRQSYRIHRVGDVSYVDSPAGAVALTELPRFPRHERSPEPGSLIAPMPGAVGRVAVAPGARVEAGDLLLTLEAMKLEHPVTAPAAGVVTAVHVTPGTQVDAGTVLAVLTPDIILTPAP